jgi:hypothetical protein
MMFITKRFSTKLIFGSYYTRFTPLWHPKCYFSVNEKPRNIQTKPLFRQKSAVDKGKFSNLETMIIQLRKAMDSKGDLEKRSPSKYRILIEKVKLWRSDLISWIHRVLDWMIQRK